MGIIQLECPHGIDVLPSPHSLTLHTFILRSHTHTPDPKFDSLPSRPHSSDWSRAINDRTTRKTLAKPRTRPVLSSSALLRSYLMFALVALLWPNGTSSINVSSYPFPQPTTLPGFYLAACLRLSTTALLLLRLHRPPVLSRIREHLQILSPVCNKSLPLPLVRPQLLPLP